MTATDREAFAELMLGIGEAYGELVSNARLEIYFSALSDLTLEELRQAATIHIQTQKFFPRVAELREAICGSAEDRATFAWLALLKLVRRVGYWGEPRWDNPVLRRAAMELYGGWKPLCERLPADGPEFLGVAKLFKATYIAYTHSYDAGQLTEGPTQDEARERLRTLREELVARSLPVPGGDNGE